jgi:hypothetical protein
VNNGPPEPTTGFRPWLRPFRVFYSFDPERQAVLLLGGDKTGKARFYEEYVPRAEALWEQYLVELTAERSKE